MTDDPQLIWTDDGPPRSGRFGDVYFSAEDGLAESRSVFLTGCGLPDAWAGRQRFTVGETGFGTGLNVLALLDLWRRARPSDGLLHLFTVEGFPLTREQAARAHAGWPELAEISAALRRRWPPRTPGFHRIELPEFSAVLDVAHGEAAAMLTAWSGLADAWFLDGFAPSANPEMWRDDVLDAITARSAPGARLATFTVAGAVRRGLEARGFAVERAPGFGRKRQRLEARFGGERVAERSAVSAAVVGGGIAGASLARALVRLGAAVVVFDPDGPAAGASGNPAALVTPRLDAGGGAAAMLYGQAFERAVDLYRSEAPEAVIAEGVLQLEAVARDAARFDRVAAQDLWPDGGLVRLNATAASEPLGEPCATGGLFFRDGLTIEPAGVVARWLDGVALERRTVAALEPINGGVLLRGEGGAALGRFDAVCVAAGPGAAALCDAPVSPVRGQASWTDGETADAAAWGGYLAPTRTGFLFGSTHDRDDTGEDRRPDDDRRNLDTLAAVRPSLAARAAADRVRSRASVRAVTADRSPLAGAAPGPPGVYVLGGLGSRGFTTAPLLAEHVAALAMGAPSPLPRELAAIVDPGRTSARRRDKTAARV